MNVELTDWEGLLPRRIDTDRLTLLPSTPEVLDPLAFYRVCSGDPAIDEVTEHLTWEPHATPKETLEFLEMTREGLDAGEDASYQLYVEPADAPGDIDGPSPRGPYADTDLVLAGGAGMGIDWDRRTGTLGTWLRKPFWGRGYSGERAAAFVALAFECLDLEVVAVEHVAGNENSRRAIGKYVERFGGRKEGALRNWALKDGEPVTQHRYSITREEYEASDAGLDVVGAP
ncbi:GNAT family N-acetyltransferase [Haloarchaeobius salinus]|uniref:GNAT family N-acetyltransferase n=1 Tax=Haloarchaeobius salinus TaxID=1198298 RepID=UPI00210CFC97|nr:GNAT family protein [Haloarchaeobius salinus]